MRYFDLHCDTLYKAVINNSTLDNPQYEVSVSAGKRFNLWRQCMAIWIPDNLSDKEGTELFQKAVDTLKCQSQFLDIPINSFSSNHCMILTVENGKILCGDIERINMLRDSGVKMLTLTWNAENCIGGGADAPQKGLSDFGKLCIPELEKNNIIIDVSHSSEKTFFDTVRLASKPIVASHSNSRKVCNHRRNLTDEQFRIIRDKKGLVGLNFHREFLNNNPSDASMKDVLLHNEHFLSLGGEDTLSIGSDFDGSEIPSDLNSIEKIPNLYESFLKMGYSEQLVQKIMFYNAYNFFSRF